MLSIVAESVLQTVIKSVFSNCVENYIDPIIKKLYNVTFDVLGENFLTRQNSKYQWKSAVDEVYFAEIPKVLKSCDWQLEAHALNTNFELLQFEIRSRTIDWKRLIVPLKKRDERSCRYLGPNFNYMGESIRIATGYRGNRPEVLLCHDMMGNYLEDRHYRTSKKWDDYRFYHWSAIDYFNYFSHSYITIPPCGWINAAHLHGVKVLGTIITEGDSGTQKLLYILESRERVEEICEALVRLCDHFCFEGWLVNIECNVPTDKVSNLIYFVGTLRDAIARNIPNGIVFWYDSVLHNGSLAWQNEINENNYRYFNVSDGMLINYNWNETSMTRTKQLVYEQRQPIKKVFFGIDVFGRGQVAKFRCRETLSKIARNDFSIGIFAPAWTYETLGPYGYNVRNLSGLYDVNDAFLRRNEKFWWLLWEFFSTHAYVEQPFFTDFCLGSGNHTYNEGGIVLGSFFNLNRQSLQPSVPLFEMAERCYDDAVFGGCCLRVLKADAVLRLFTTNFRVKKTLIFAYAYKVRELDGEFECVLRFTSEMSGSQKDGFIYCGDYEHSLNIQRGKCFISPINNNYYEYLIDFMEESRASIKIPFYLQNRWNVRYYGVTFDNEVEIKDIGMRFKKKTSSYGASAFLGAIYFNSFPNEAYNLLGSSNWARISSRYVLRD